MFPKILTQIFGSRNDRLLKTYRRDVERRNRNLRAEREHAERGVHTQRCGTNSRNSYADIDHRRQRHVQR